MAAPVCAPSSSAVGNWTGGINRDIRLSSKRDDGQSLVEFALTLPIVLLIVTGICAFGITIAHYMILTDASNVGGRQLAILRGYSDPCAMVANTIQGAAPTLTSSDLDIKFVVEGISYSKSCNGAGTLMTPGHPATVTINYPCSLVVFGNNFAKMCNLQAQTTELVQ